MKYSKLKFTNKKFFIYGFAKSGLATLKFLKKNKSKIICWDDNILVRKNIKKKYLLNPKKKLDNQSFDYIVVSPGIDIRKCYLKKFLKKNNHKIITDLDIFFHFNKSNQIISITGTNGKSTTCKLLEEVFRRAGYKTQLVGNIGKPILTYKKSSKKIIFIIEVSSYQLEYTQYFKSNHAAILNISPDHIERHETMKNYVNIKAKVFSFQSLKDHAYINLNNKFTKKIIKNFKKNKLRPKLSIVDKYKFSKIFNKIKNKYLLSQNNLENISFVIQIANNYKIKSKVILETLNMFKGLPHRQEKIKLTKSIICINDSKATSFEASSQSLQSYENIFWIVGGLHKMKDHFFLNKLKKNIIKAYIIGENIGFFKRQLQNKIDFLVVGSLKNAVLKIINDIKQKRKKDNSIKIKYTILFSPAAASFDQYKNFEERGNVFKKLIYKNKLNIN